MDHLHKSPPSQWKRCFRTLRLLPVAGNHYYFFKFIYTFDLFFTKFLLPLLRLLFTFRPTSKRSILSLPRLLLFCRQRRCHCAVSNADIDSNAPPNLLSSLLPRGITLVAPSSLSQLMCCCVPVSLPVSLPRRRQQRRHWFAAFLFPLDAARTSWLVAVSTLSARYALSQLCICSPSRRRCATCSVQLNASSLFLLASRLPRRRRYCRRTVSNADVDMSPVSSAYYCRVSRLATVILDVPSALSQLQLCIFFCFEQQERRRRCLACSVTLNATVSPPRLGLLGRFGELLLQICLIFPNSFCQKFDVYFYP